MYSKCYMINTYNESSLHNTLKKLYSLTIQGNTEQQIDKWICDVIGPDGQIVEIQTGSLAPLYEKTRALLEAGHPVTIVHPIIKTKRIQTIRQDGSIQSTRKSPKSESIYSCLRSITKMYPLLLTPGFILELPEITITESRVLTNAPVQLTNKSRRHLRNWIKTDKKLEEIEKTHRFCTAEDYLALLPVTTGSTFSVPDIQQCFAAMSKPPADARKYTGLLIWLLLHMKLITCIKTEGKKKIYSRV